ncbi:hypothetical protein Cgig2_005896 [Carnegiea gigantea]|uniref:Uncharacterized protein n=1 Tax=Carnegiea gigantea TaxID=171969 RepID=A0A9Q1JPV3_9CARY|nr:hypothetical protein Cgig2_005896 [Carnegiea gigantea]
MRKVQVFGTILEDKGAPVACERNCEQQNSLEAQNSDTLKMLNANVNRLMKHMVDHETSKSNKHMTDTCTTTYIAHPLKSSEKKESPMQFENADEIKRKRRIVAEHNFSKNDMRSANELTKSISVGGLNFLHEEDKKVNVNKVIDMVASELILESRKRHLNRIYLPTYFQVNSTNLLALFWVLK